MSIRSNRISIWIVFTLLVYVTAQTIPCVDVDPQACAYYVKSFPSYCTSSIAYLKKVRFNIYCINSCNNCNAVTLATAITSTKTSTVSPASSNMPVTTASSASTLSTSSGTNCKNVQDYACQYFLQIYPDFCQSPTIYISGMTFNVFCAKTCKYMC